MKKQFLLFLALGFLAQVSAQTTRFVNPTATGNYSGLTWADGYGDVCAAIANANEGDTVLVKAGTYKSTCIFDKSLHLYGGFAGTESYSFESDPTNNPTIITGDYNGDDIAGDVSQNKSDNYSYLLNIYPAAGDPFSSSIYGFTFKGAYSTNQSGSALRVYNNLAKDTVSLIVRNCIFEENACSVNDGGGGAIFVASTADSAKMIAKFDKCTFRNNQTFGTNNIRGSVMFIYSYGDGDVQAHITNSLFYDNTDVSPFGNNCVIYQGNSSLTGKKTLSYIFNNTFANNNSQAAVFYWNGYGSGELISNFSNNIVNNQTPGLYIGTASTSGNSYTVVTRHNLWNSDPVDNVSGLFTPGNSNIENSNPGFTDSANDDYSLSSSSVCINAADTAGYSFMYLDNFDYTGNNRFFGSSIDIGAFENQVVTGADKMVKGRINVYPNPCPGTFVLELSSLNTDCKVFIYNYQGQLINSLNVIDQKTEIKLPEISGIYFLKLIGNEGERTVKIVRD